MGPGDVLGLIAVLGLPALFFIYLARRFFSFKEKQLEVEARNTAERAAQYATANAELEARVRVLEKIVTDGGLETAAQIEALRTPRLTDGDKVQ